MIQAAAKALKVGGRLLMVANRGLPYEPVQKEAFKDSGEVAAIGYCYECFGIIVNTALLEKAMDFTFNLHITLFFLRFYT